MKIKEAIFAGSSDRNSGKPKQKFPEFAFIGRSNVGKSSLINMLTGNNKLAKTSSSPGKTQTINHFLINKTWYLVDLPGYGYAKMSKTGRQKLEQIIHNYLNLSQELVLLFVLIDCRHDLQDIDRDFLDFLGMGGIPFSIIFTKADKLGTQARALQIEKIRQQILEHWEELPPIFVSSADSGLGKEEILDYVETVMESVQQANNDTI